MMYILPKWKKKISGPRLPFQGKLLKSCSLTEDRFFIVFILIGKYAFICVVFEQLAFFSRDYVLRNDFHVRFAYTSSHSVSLIETIWYQSFY